MHITRFRSAALLAAAPLTLALLAGCSGTASVTGSAGPAGVTPTGSVSSAPAASATGSSAASTGSSGSAGSSKAGCPAGGSVPAGADTATTADLDGDGKADTLWIADVGSKREFGVKTASGAVIGTTFQNSAPIAAYVVADVVGGYPMILLNAGRSVPVYTLTGCKIAVTKNVQGQQYTFDRGFTGYGTGVGCPVLSGKRTLVGYLAKADDKGDEWTVTRTAVSLSASGTRAANAGTTTLGKDLKGTDALVKQAQGVSCGTGGAAAEPMS